MKYNRINYNNKTLKRINKTKAENILQHPKKYDGVTIYTLPVNANPNSPWINGFFEITNNFNERDAVDNITQLAEIQYYNCDKELGSYLKYYMEDIKCND